MSLRKRRYLSGELGAAAPTKVRMGSYLFESKDDLCFVSGMCGNESWSFDTDENLVPQAHWGNAIGTERIGANF